MKYNDPKEVEAALGKMTLKQLWAVVKIAKYVRLRARNNTAFNNYMNAIFPYARFEQVTKVRADGQTYPGLRITIEGESLDGEE